MHFYIDDEQHSLDKLKNRIKNTDLVPSRELLLINIDEIFENLKALEILSLADLRKHLKTSKAVNELSSRSGIDKNYLTILHREIESYFPKPRLLKEFDWLPEETRKELITNSLVNTKIIYEVLNNKETFKKICGETKLEPYILLRVFELSDLTRIQWLSPLFTRIIHEAGYDSSLKISLANADELCNAVDLINKNGKYFKGKIGLRDIKRVIESAKYLTQ